MSQLAADLLLLLVTLIWGTTFVIVKNAIASMRPLTYISIRFLVAGAVLLGWYVVRRVGRNLRSKGEIRVEVELCSGEAHSRRFLTGSLITGVALLFSYITQTLGLITVPAGKAAFITGLSVVIVPVASGLLLRKAPDRASVIGVVLATTGLGLMSLKLPLTVEAGDLLVFLCAIGFASHILLVEAYSDHGDTVLFAAIQLLVVSLGSFIGALVFERPLVIPGKAWGAILFTALAATSFAFLTQSAVQRYTTATHTALILSVEPVFGAFFAWLLVDEVLTPREIAGAIAILGGMLVSELGSLRRTAPSHSAGTSHSMD